MAGIIRIFSGSWDSTGNIEGDQYWFHYMKSFFDAHPSYTRIASYYGIGGTGFDSPTGSNPSGENRWCVWRNSQAQEPFDIIIAATFDNITYPPASNPSGSLYYSDLSNSYNGYAFGIAWHSSSVAWNGTTNNDGKDRFITYPWKSGSVIFPSYNSPNANGRSYRNVLQTFTAGNFGGEGGKVYLIADNDSFSSFIKNISDTSFTLRGITFEKYIPLTSSIDFPYIMYSNNFGGASVFGGYDAVTSQGGMGVKKNNGVNLNLSSSQPYFFVYSVPITDSNYPEIDTDDILAYGFNEYPIMCYIGPPNIQLGGYLTWTKAVSNRMQMGEIISGGNRVVLRYNNSNYAFTVPWDYSSQGLLSASYGVNYLSSSVFQQNNNWMMLYTSSLYPTRSIGGLTFEYIYRGRTPSGYVYGTTNPPTSDSRDVVIVKRLN